MYLIGITIVLFTTSSNARSVFLKLQYIRITRKPEEEASGWAPPSKLTMSVWVLA